MRAMLFQANYDYLGYAQNKSKTAGGGSSAWASRVRRDELNQPTGTGYSGPPSFASGWGWKHVPGVRGKMLQQPGGSSDRLVGVDFGRRPAPSWASA